MNSVLQDVPTPAARSVLIAVAACSGNASTELFSGTRADAALAGLSCVSDDSNEHLLELVPIGHTAGGAILQKSPGHVSYHVSFA